MIAKVSDALAHPVAPQTLPLHHAVQQVMQTVCNKDLVANFDYAQATISQHMKKLAEVRFDPGKQEGKNSLLLRQHWASPDAGTSIR